MTVNVSDWSETPSSNSTVDGINIAEGCPAGNVNGGLRAIMAGVKTMFLALPNLADYLKKDGSTATTGQLIYSGRGAYIHNADTSLTSGRRFVQAIGGSVPAGMQDGDELLEYS